MQRVTDPASLLHELDERLAQVIDRAERVREVPDKLFEGVDTDLARIGDSASRLKSMLAGLGTGRTALGPRLRHDLRTPLNHILGYGEMLLQEADETGRGDVAGDLQVIVSAGRDVLGALDGLVKMVRDHAEHTPVVPVARAARPPAALDRVTGRILVVDDNPDNRELLQRRLSRVGHDVATAADGGAALTRMEQDAFDLVLLDLVMPVLDGTEVLRRLKEDEHLRHVPVIVISGMDELPSVALCIQLGADDYLTKPFEPVLLDARIRACLEKKELRDREVDHLKQIETERRRADELLRVLFPEPIVRELKDSGTVRPRRHERVAVMFCDIVGFTAYSERREPEDVVASLQALVVRYEAAAARHRLLKIKTIGDSFMAVAGLDAPVDNPVASCVRCAEEMIAIVDGLGTGWSVRIGVHVGPVVAGVLGRSQYQYDLWGDTVNTASRVESHGIAGGIMLSDAAWRMLSRDPRARASRVGKVPVKGKGPVELFHFAGWNPNARGQA